MKQLVKAMDNFQQTFSKLRSAILKRDQQTALEIMNSAYDEERAFSLTTEAKVIAIDGSSASGKGTLAKSIAEN